MDLHEVSPNVARRHLDGILETFDDLGIAVDGYAFDVDGDLGLVARATDRLRRGIAVVARAGGAEGERRDAERRRFAA